MVVVLCLVAAGLVATGHGDRSEYLANLDARIESQPDSVRLLLERAEVHRRLGHRDEALADLDRVFAISPGQSRVHYLIGLNHLDAQLFGDAEFALRRFLEDVPDSPSAHIALAEALTGQDRHLDAAEQYDLAIALQPTPVPDHFLARARSYRAAGERYLATAVEGLDEGMRIIGPLVTLQKLAIDTELARGNHAGAIVRIDAVLATIERKETWLVNKATVLASAGRHGEAVDAFRMASEALNSLPRRVRSSPAMVALAETISRHLHKDTTP